MNTEETQPTKPNLDDVLDHMRTCAQLGILANEMLRPEWQQYLDGATTDPRCDAECSRLALIRAALKATDEQVMKLFELAFDVKSDSFNGGAR